MVVDDLLATGGTLRAVVDLLESVEAVPASVFVLVELTALNGRQKLAGKVDDVEALIKF